jgi:hypothetical protein
VVSQAGAAILLATAQRTGLTSALSAALASWRKPLASHDPDKIVLHLAVALAMGGDCLADVGLLRTEPGLFGVVAFDPTVSRLITALAAEAPKALAAISCARAAARTTAWAGAGDRAPDHGIDAEAPLIIDIDATLVTAHSDKEQAVPTFKRGYRFHPLCAFIDHGADGTGEPLAIQLRTGNAGSNIAPITRRCWPRRWPSCHEGWRIASDARCWCGLIPPAAPMSSSPACTSGACRIRLVSSCPMPPVRPSI